MSNLTQKFVVQELMRYYEYWKGDEVYRLRLRNWWETAQLDPKDPYRGAYREVLRQLGDG
jgi:hypothetical protein